MSNVALEHEWWVSPEEYLDGEELAQTKHEYVGGMVYAMAGARNRHNQIAVNALLEVGGQLRGRPCQPCNSDTKVRVRRGDDVRFYYPDAMVVCEPNDLDEVFQDRPVVIFEVISDSTARTDREEKLRAYQSIPTLRVYAIIESERLGVTCYRRQDESAPWLVELCKERADNLSLDAIGCDVSMEALYARSGL
jgi:Uma2 family endonuclease